MRLVICDKKDDVGQLVAAYVVKRISDFKPTAQRPFVLGLPTGSSPLECYKHIIKLFKDGKVSFEHVVTFNMDEYCDLARDHPESYHSFMWENLFRHIDIQPQNVNLLDGNASDRDAECRRYEEKIVAVGGIKLFLAGIGPDGHIAFNEPGSSLSSRSNPARRLTPQASRGGTPRLPPTRAAPPRACDSARQDARAGDGRGERALLRWRPECGARRHR